MQQLLLGLFALTLPLLAFGQMKTITQDGYAVDYPPQVQLVEQSTGEWTLSWSNANSPSSLQPSIQLSTSKLPQGEKLGGYVIIRNSVHKMRWTEHRILKNKAQGLGKNRVHRYIATCKEEAHTVYYRMDTRTRKGSYYTLSFKSLAPPSAQDLQIAEQIFKSFRWQP